MSERLADEELAAMTIMSVPVESKRFSRETVLDVRAMATELRSRRALDLTAEEVEALRGLRKVVSHAMEGDRVDAWLAVLDRCIGAKP